MYFRMKFALFFRFFNSWYIIKYLTYRQSRVRKTYCFPRSQSISVKYRQQNRMIFVMPIVIFLLRLPVGRGGVINSPRSVFLFSVSQVGLPLMGDTAVRLSPRH